MKRASTVFHRRSCVPSALCGLMFFTISWGANAQAPSASSYAIVHGKVVTLAGAPIENGTLVIRDGKIAAAGANIEIPAGAQVIDATGLQVYPGLFDPITQMGLSEISAVHVTVDTTETGKYNPDVIAATAVLPSSEHIRVTRAAGITEVLAVPASSGFFSGASEDIIGGQATAMHLAGWTISDLLLQKSVAMVLNWPQIDVHATDPAAQAPKPKTFSDARENYQKQVDELTDWFERTRHYAQVQQKNPSARFDRDVKLEALVPVVRGELPLLVFADKARDIRNAVEYCEKQKLKMILAGGLEAWKVKDLLRSKNIAVVLRPTLTYPVDEDDAYDRLLTQPAELVAAGVKIAFGSFDNSFARRLGQQAANAVAHGLSYYDGLRAVTIAPAEIFGLSDRVGTLESGKVANLIVTNGDPLELTTDVRYLFIKGQLTSTDNKQKALYEKYANRPKTAQ